MLIPEALAHPNDRRRSPVVGLYAGAGALLLTAVLAARGRLVMGPMSATAALVGTHRLGELVTGGGGEFAARTTRSRSQLDSPLACRFLRMGFHASFISER